MKIVVIDYGVGNINSITGALNKLNVSYEFTNDLNLIELADKLILRGVGSFAKGMQNLKDFNLIDTLNHQVINKKKEILGICLGAQLFCKSSEENGIKTNGLGWLDAEVKKFPKECKIIPHMGWNIVKTKNITKFYNENNYLDLYFVHSYFIDFKKIKNDILVEYSTYYIDFPAMIFNRNIIGAQFHPEKSQRHGLEFLNKFINA